MRYVCIFAAPRTGSNQLCRLLRSCKWLSVKGELFHPKWVGMLRYEEHWCLYGLSGGANGVELCDWRSENAGWTLEALHQMSSRVVLFKLFRGHLTQDVIAREIFARDDVAYIVLKRRPIEAYISALKAMAAGRYTKVDTTSVLPALEVPDFLEWAERTRAWYAWVERELAARAHPFLPLTYEAHINVGDDRAARDAILAGLETLGVAGPEPRRTLPPLIRQDRGGRYQDRVANWATFETAMCGTPEHVALLAWAEAA